MFADAFCKKRREKKRKKRERRRCHWTQEALGLGVSEMRFNKRVAQGPGEGILVMAAAGRKGGRERGRQATCWDEMGIKGLEVGRKGGACEHQRLWRLEHIRHLGLGGWLVGVVVEGGGLVQ